MGSLSRQASLIADGLSEATNAVVSEIISENEAQKLRSGSSVIRVITVITISEFGFSFFDDLVLFLLRQTNDGCRSPLILLLRFIYPNGINFALIKKTERRILLSRYKTLLVHLHVLFFCSRLSFLFSSLHLFFHTFFFLCSFP